MPVIPEYDCFLGMDCSCSRFIACISKREEVRLSSKAGWGDGADEISLDELV